MKNKKGYSEEECLKRMKSAFDRKGLDYESYVKHIEEKKRKRNVKREEYRSNHEDNVQFGCCPWDCGTLDNGFPI